MPWRIARALGLRFFPYGILAVEALLRRRKISGAEAREMASNIHCGLLSSLVNTFSFAAFLRAYVVVQDWAASKGMHLSLVPELFCAFLAHTFIYYWVHRCEHRFAPLWKIHSVHHQPRYMNMTVSLRGAMLSDLLERPPYLLCALLGIRPETFALIGGVGMYYSILIHTEGGPSPRLLRWTFLSSPSTHRVHHGIEPEYLNRNFGLMETVWDRLFGTFQEEKGHPVFGTLEGEAPPTALAANLIPLFGAARTASAPAQGKSTKPDLERLFLFTLFAIGITQLGELAMRRSAWFLLPTILALFPIPGLFRSEREEAHAFPLSTVST